MTNLTIAIFLATANYAIVEYLADPIRQRFPHLNLWWLVYVAFVTGAAISYAAGANLFGDVVANELLARLLTAAVVGGGSNLIYKVFGR
jgi:hypothetical protein